LIERVHGAVFPCRGQRLWIDVESIDARSAEARGGQCENARAAAVVDHAPARHAVFVEPLEAQRRARMGTGAKREARVEVHDLGALRAHLLVSRADPQAAAEAHRPEVPEPLAFPGTVRDELHVDACGADAKVRGESRDQRRRGARAIEQRLHAGRGPQPHFAGLRLQDGVVASVAVNDGLRAMREAAILH
jgi:hypothetical protein